MKENSFILVVLLLSVGVVIGLTLWNDHGGQDDMWSPNDMYSKHDVMSRASSTFTSASYSSGMTNDGVALTIRHRSFGSARAHVPTYSYARNTVGTSTYNQSSFASSPSGGLHTTSSVEFRSFGGGGMSSGISMSGGKVSSSNSGGIAQASGLFTGIPSSGALSSWGKNMQAKENGVGVSVLYEDMKVMDPIANVASSSNGSNGMFAGFGYASVMDQYGMASYGDSQRRITNRRNGEVHNSWLQWLALFGSGYYTDNGDGTCTYTEDAIRAAYDDYINNYWDDSWDEEKPTIDEWWAWFSNGELSFQGKIYKLWSDQDQPIGDVWILLVLALIYIVYVAIRRKAISDVIMKGRA